MKLGDTFIWFPPDGRKEHLYIVVTDPAKNGGKFAAFNLTRSHGGMKALTFQVGEHPFITQYPSDVNFGDALIMDEVTASKNPPHHPMDSAMVKKIAIGAMGHPAIPEEVEDMVKTAWGF